MMRQLTPQQKLMRTTLRPTLLGSLLALALLAGSSGCVYRMAIQQGNFLDPGQVAQLENGMTRSQVAFLLGTPMIPQGFDNNRWDYFYYLKEQRLKTADSRRITVYFEDDKVARVEKGPEIGEAPHIGRRNRS
jgi:outer membrane protein assembly factor BamE